MVDGSILKIAPEGTTLYVVFSRRPADRGVPAAGDARYTVLLAARRPEQAGPADRRCPRRRRRSQRGRASSGEPAALCTGTPRPWNVFVEGDNLDVLPRFPPGSVDLVYIDPPYNTGNDFAYRDDFRDGGAGRPGTRPGWR